MLKLHTWTTPNGIKPLILLEESGIAYETHWVDLGKGEQHERAYVKVNPNAKIPALEDDGVPIFESGAIPYAVDRYRKETERIYGVLDKRLGEAEYLAGEYGIADIATFGWARSFARLEIDPAPFQNVTRWLERVGHRPAVQRAVAMKPPQGGAGKGR